MNFDTENIYATQKKLKENELAMHKMLNKEYAEPEIVKECVHSSDGLTYQDSDVTAYVTYRCQKCGMFYDVPTR